MYYLAPSRPVDAISMDDMVEIIRRQLKGRARRQAVLTAEISLEDLGLSSLAVTEVFFKLEEKVGFELDPGAAADVKTIGDLLTVINQLVAQHDS